MLTREEGEGSGGEEPKSYDAEKTWSSIIHSILPALKGRHPGPHEDHELVKKLIILKYGQYLTVLVELADILALMKAMSWPRN